MNVASMLRCRRAIEADACAHEEARANVRRVRLAAFTACVEEVLSSGACYSLETLALKGSEIAARFTVRPEETGKLLDLALCAVIENEAANEKEELLSYLESYLKKRSDL